MVSTAEIEMIKQQIINRFSPSKIILFGSQAKKTAGKKSDIDLCIVKNTESKRELITDMYLNIDSSKPFDLVLYTEKEWVECIKDKTSFAHIINTRGTEIYG